MKKTTRNILIVACSIVVLGGATAALLLTGGGSSGSSSSVSSTTTIPLLSKKESDVATMKVTNEKGGFTISPKEVTVETSVSSGSLSSSGSNAVTTKMTYPIEGMDGIPLDSYAPQSVLDNAYSLNASKEVGEVNNLADYGLSSPKTKVEVTFKDGSTYKYLVGSASAGDSSSYYLCADGSNKVYVVTLAEQLFYGKLDFADKELLSITNPNDTTGQQEVMMDSIKLSGSNFPLPITISQNKDGIFRLISDREVDPDSDKLSALTKSLSSLTADSVVCAYTPDLAQKYGFDAPTAVAELDAYSKHYKLTVGKQDGTKWYLLKDGANVVYEVEDSKISTWVHTDVFTLRDKFVLLTNIVDVSKMTVKLDNTPYEFVIGRTKDEAKSTADKPAYNYTLTGNGKELNYDYFKKYYQSIIAIQLLEPPADEKISGSPEITVTYEYYEDTKKSTNTVAFYPISDRRYLATVNGVVAGIIKQDSLQRVRDNTPKIMDNQQVNPGV